MLSRASGPIQKHTHQHHHAEARPTASASPDEAVV